MGENTIQFQSYDDDYNLLSEKKTFMM